MILNTFIDFKHMPNGPEIKEQEVVVITLRKPEEPSKLYKGFLLGVEPMENRSTNGRPYFWYEIEYTEGVNPPKDLARMEYDLLRPYHSGDNCNVYRARPSILEVAIPKHFLSNLIEESLT